MQKNVIQFIRELQVSDEKRKRKWLIGLTVPAMGIVFLAWSFFFHPRIIPLQSADVDATTNENTTAIMGRGFAFLGTQFGRGMVRFGQMINTRFLWGSTEIVVQKEHNFILPTLEPITPKTLNGY